MTGSQHPINIPSDDKSTCRGEPLSLHDYNRFAKPAMFSPNSPFREAKMYFCFDFRGRLYLDAFSAPLTWILPSVGDVIVFNGEQEWALQKIRLPSVGWRVRVRAFDYADFLLERVTLTLCPQASSQALFNEGTDADHEPWPQAIPFAFKPKTPPRPKKAALSGRESEILAYLRKGMRNRDIASRLNVSEKTISTFKSRIKQKLGAKSHGELVEYDESRLVA